MGWHELAVTSLNQAENRALEMGTLWMAVFAVGVSLLAVLNGLCLHNK
ncbi:hypothetical protein KAM380_030910 [Aeromonas caviae]|nr:hypothetical protein KAM380_030910 [Aeromonas caviae]